MELVYAVLVLLLLLLASLALVGRRMLGYYAEHTSWRFPRALVSETAYLPGDIVLFTVHTHGFVNSLFTRDFYSHAAVVVAEPGTGDLYLSESMIGDEVMPGPPGSGTELVAGGRAVLLPLYARLKFYQGEHFLMRLAPGLTPAESDALWAHAQTDTPYPSVWNSLLRIAGLGLLLRDGGHRSRHCMAHVGWLLDRLGLTPADLLAQGKALHREPYLSLCRRITRLPGERLGRGAHTYLPPVHMLYDLDAGAVPVPAAGGRPAA